MAPLNPELTVREENDFELLLDYLKQDGGFDIIGYKRASLIRRVSSRMRTVGVDSFAAYLDRLQVDPQEFTELFDTILINVTGFFRDPQAWDALASEAIPRLLEEKPAPEPIRVWSAGCASGEEAYTLAILLAEALGDEQMRERVKIYGTDVDEAALTAARHGTYTAKAIGGVPEELRERYFDHTAAGFVFRKDLRRAVIFGRHDIVHAAPISHIDLLACRNTIMYLNSETQARVLARLHFALRTTAYSSPGRPSGTACRSSPKAAATNRSNTPSATAGSGRWPPTPPRRRRSWSTAPAPWQ